MYPTFGWSVFASGHHGYQHVPEVEVKIFDALSEVKRQKPIDAGLVKIVPHCIRDFCGRIDVKTL